MGKRRKKDDKKGLGAGLLGAVAGALASWFLFGTEKGEETRNKAKKLADDAKKEIEKRVDEAEDLTEKKYNEIIDEVSEKYENVKNIDKKELEEMVSDMRDHWERIKKQVMEGGSKSKKKKGKK
ncbi:MAG: YtxH domain-containing protein [Candidatus Spechtbacterales bacterium]|nr:YtxH domain-containing protein [Candidatus Spechtbacterales bacterium]